METSFYSIPRLHTLTFIAVTALVTSGYGHGSSSDGPGNGVSNVCTNLTSKLLEFYATVYGQYEEPFLLQNQGYGHKNCLRAQDASTDNFAEVGLIRCDTTDNTQIIKISNGDTGFLINLPLGDKCLTLDSSSPETGNLLYQITCQNGGNQQWYFNYASDKKTFQIVYMLSGNCLTGNGENIGVTTCANITKINSVPKNKLWQKLDSQLQLPTGQLINKLTNKCVQAGPSMTASDFAKVGLQKCSSDNSQKLKFELGIKNLQGQTISLSTGKVLSIMGGETYEAEVQQMAKFYYGNQLWQVTKLINDWLQIRNVATPSYCLAAGADGASLVTRYCTDVWQASDIDDNPQQFWKFNSSS